VDCQGGRRERVEKRVKTHRPIRNVASGENARRKGAAACTGRCDKYKMRGGITDARGGGSESEMSESSLTNQGMVSVDHVTR